jgi:short-subunit dehydrogenase
MSTWLITGCSTGLGRALAEAVIGAGHKAVLPGMRARRSGAIVNISSIGAQVTPVGSGYYSAAKAAIEGVSGALRGELAPLGISVTVVEPGAFRTDFAGRSLVQSATVIDDYAATAGQRRKENDTIDGNQAGDPAKAGSAIITAVESSDPPGFLLLGSDALALYRYVAAEPRAPDAAGDARADEIGKWEQLTASTNLDS